MALLDDRAKIRKIDRADMLSLLEAFPKQLEEALAIGRRFRVRSGEYTGIQNICFTGLGGSAIGADLIRDFTEDRIRVPIWVNRAYELPCFVDRRTLLIVSSYSGDTEETLACFQEGWKRRACMVSMTSNGELARLSAAKKIPCVRIPAGYPPRAALGFSLVPLLMFLKKIGKIAFDERELEETVRLLHRLKEKEYGVEIPQTRNPAKRLAVKLLEKLIVIYASSRPLEAVALRWRGQMEENAKSLAFHHVLPEMNHNEILGWRGPNPLFRRVAVLFLRDRGEHRRVSHRMRITRALIRKEKVETLELFSKGHSLFARIFSLIYLGDFTSFYLSILNNVDPSAVEKIDDLKAELKKL